MANNEIKESRNEISKIVKKPVENIYGLAGLLRVFLARCIDLLIAAIPAIICVWVWKPAMDVTTNAAGKHVLNGGLDWSYIVVNYLVELVSILVFFVVIPSFTKGTTIGKSICGIRLKRSTGDKKVKWYMLLAREAYFLLVPWLIGIIFKVIGLAVLINGPHENKINYGAQVINQLGIIFYMLWFIFVGITIKFQDEHQSGIDMKFGLFVVYKEPIKQVVKEAEVKERSLILTDEPGNLSKESIDELDNSEKKKFNKSISLEDLDLTITKESKKKNDDEPKKIEGDK